MTRQEREWLWKHDEMMRNTHPRNLPAGGSSLVLDDGESEDELESLKTVAAPRGKYMTRQECYEAIFKLVKEGGDIRPIVLKRKFGLTNGQVHYALSRGKSLAQQGKNNEQRVDERVG